MKFGTGVHVICWEVGVFNRSCFRSVSCKKKLYPFPFDLMQNSVVSSQILAKIYRLWLKECEYHIIQQYSDQN